MFGEKRSCPYCEGINIIQIYKHDSWACIDCNEWLEEPCNDANCPYCGGRPETPYEVYWNTDFNAGSSHTRKMWRYVVTTDYLLQKRNGIKHDVGGHGQECPLLRLRRKTMQPLLYWTVSFLKISESTLCY